MQLNVTSVSNVSLSLSAQPSNSVCPGDTVTFKAIPVNGGLTPTYDWFIDGIAVQNGSKDSLVTNNFMNGSKITTILHTSASCAAPLLDSATLIVTVNSAFVPLVSISPDTSLCPGSPLTLTTSAINGGTFPNYQWFVNGVMIPGATSSSYSFIFTPPDSVYHVQLNSSLSCVSSGAAFDSTIINNLQNLQAVVNIAANPVGIVCAGDTVNYSAHTQNGGSSPQFQWYLNGILTSVTDSVFTIVPSDNDSISVQLTSSLNCLANVIDDDYKIASVSPSVSPSVSLAASPASIICKGDTITFLASAVNAGSFPFYSWFVNGNSVGINDTIYTTSSLNNNDSVSVILTTSLACAPVLTDTDLVKISVVGNVMPAVSIQTSGGACEGDSVKFIADALNGGSSPVFQWFVNGINMGLSNDTIELTTLKNGDSVQVFLTSSLGCVSTTNAVSLFYISVQQPRLIPQIGIKANPSDTLCVGQLVILNSNILNGGSLPSIQWFVNSILQKDTSSTFVSASLGMGDVIVATLNSNANCLIQPTDTSNFIRIVYHQPLKVQLTSGAPDCPGIPATITAHVSGGNGGPYHLTWSNGIIDKDIININPLKNSVISVQADDNCTIKSATNTFTIPVLTGPVSDFAYLNPSPGSFQNNIQFKNLSTDADNWLWIFPESNTTSTELNPLHQFPKQGSYEVILATRNNDGCVDTVKYIVYAQEEIAVFYPNSFSPNGDGKNDYFQPLGASLEDYEMTIWNRWGELVYSGNSKSSWNGMILNGSSPAPEGVYVFRIDLKSDKFDKKVVTGNVTLIR